VHFESAIHSPEAIGRKAMNRNLSDCAAMACLPAAALVTLALPIGSGTDYAKQLFLGIKQAGERFDCPVVGGDTASWPGKLVVTVMILGRSDGITPITRAGAQPGDHIYVTGPLGGSILGRHMTFEPRIDLARDLSSRYRLHAMADISDGLARDLKNICDASSVGATLETAVIPIHDDVRRLKDGKDAAFHAIHDGEDYELLIVSPDVLPAPCLRIGSIDRDTGIRLQSTHSKTSLDFLATLGWEHPL
jgi:thiamine-monophosphate kinase